MLDLDQISREISGRKAVDALRYITKLGIKNFAPEYFYSLTAEIFLREYYLSKALAEVDKALMVAPSWAPAHNIRGNILVEMARFDEALDSFDRAVASAPDVGEYRFNRGQLLFLLERWEEGRADYEFRLNSPLFQPVPEIASRPLWRGQSAPEGRVLLYWEQGQGDTLQFVRFIRWFLEKGIPVTLEVQESLVRLIAQSFPSVQVIGAKDPLPSFAHRMPIPSLPWLLEDAAETLNSHAYLRASPDSALCERASHPAVGLVWAGNPSHVNDCQRSLPQEQMLTLTQLSGITFYSLQVGISDRQKRALNQANVTDLAPGFMDFADTAAAIMALDLVITVDTSVAHLAGGLGKPVWILLPFVPDWRWGLGRSNSAWYPSARLFRQPKRGDWASVLKEVKWALDDLQDQGDANNAP